MTGDTPPYWPKIGPHPNTGGLLGSPLRLLSGTVM
jgi:hypothetical protein